MKISKLKNKEENVLFSWLDDIGMQFKHLRKRLIFNDCFIEEFVL
jgi:hypothetical protein